MKKSELQRLPLRSLVQELLANTSIASDVREVINAICSRSGGIGLYDLVVRDHSLNQNRVCQDRPLGPCPTDYEEPSYKNENYLNVYRYALALGYDFSGMDNPETAREMIQIAFQIDDKFEDLHQPAQRFYGAFRKNFLLWKNRRERG